MFRFVRLAPEIAGSVAGNLASAIVPVVILAASARFVAVVAVPVKLPSKDVDVVTPVTTAPSGNVGAAPTVLPFKLVTLKFDIRDLRFEVRQ